MVFLTRWFTECNPQYRFRVVVQTSAYGPGIKGIISAYQEWR